MKRIDFIKTLLLAPFVIPHLRMEPTPVPAPPLLIVPVWVKKACEEAARLREQRLMWGHVNETMLGIKKEFPLSKYNPYETGNNHRS